MMEENFNGIKIEIYRSNRKTISIELKADRLIVRAPHRMSDQEVHAFVHKKKAWIVKYQQQMLERQEIIQQQGMYTLEELSELAEKALVVIPEKVKHYAPLVGVDYGRITIRSQRTRWGSCSGKGNLNFNCLLMLLPDEVINSVVVHELCHRKHMNHSVQFYAEVERVFPEYKRWNRWLNENGGRYLSRLQ